MLPEVVVGLTLLIAAVVAITLFELFSDAAESMNKDLKKFLIRFRKMKIYEANEALFASLT